MAAPRSCGSYKPAPPAPKKAEKKRSPTCLPLDPAEVARVEARIRAELVVYQKPSKLVVDFGCDVAATAEQVVFEDGAGHGGSLRIARFRRSQGGVEVTLIDSHHHGRRTVEVSEGMVEESAFDVAVGRGRVALVAKPHLVPLSGGGLHLTASFSSYDFHLRLSITDGDGDTTDRGFTGYESSGDQEKYLPMRLAAAPVERLLDRAKLSVRKPTDADRRFVTKRFLLTFEGEPYWWIRERYIGLVAALGTSDAVPVLVRAASTKPDPHDPSVERTRTAALDAIGAITGWDPWFDARGQRRDLEAAAIVAAAACAP